VDHKRNEILELQIPQMCKTTGNLEKARRVKRKISNCELKEKFGKPQKRSEDF
jgi:hypothetical protein